MQSNIDISKLSSLIKSKRGNKGLRIAVKEIGDISASTLSRIEQGSLPDLETFMRICKWLDVPQNVFQMKKSKETSNKELIVAHLRAEKNLSKETTDALIQMINLAYNSKKKK